MQCKKIFLTMFGSQKFEGKCEEKKMEEKKYKESKSEEKYKNRFKCNKLFL